MKVNVGIERTAEALDQRHRAGLRGSRGTAGLGESDESQFAIQAMRSLSVRGSPAPMPRAP